MSASTRCHFMFSRNTIVFLKYNCLFSRHILVFLKYIYFLALHLPMLLINFYEHVHTWKNINYMYRNHLERIIICCNRMLTFSNWLATCTCITKLQTYFNCSLQYYLPTSCIIIEIFSPIWCLGMLWRFDIK